MVNVRGFFALIASRRGAAAAEFAVMLPLLMTVMFGTVQLGLLMYSYNLMATAARDTVRQMAVCTIVDPSTATSFTLNPSLASLPPWVPQAHWVITPAFGSPDVSVSISVPTTDAAVLSFLPLGLGTLSTSVEMRKEPLAYGTGAC